MNNKILCRTAGVAAFVIWPIIVVAGFLLAITVLLLGVGLIHEFIGGRAMKAIALGALALVIICIYGYEAYEWVQAKCSAGNKPTAERM